VKLREMLLLSLTPFRRYALIAAATLLTLVVGSLHLVSGLAYEFHVLFIIPLLPVAWYAGALPGYMLALVAVLLWYFADSSLGGGQAELFPLIFNSSMRLIIVVGGVWLFSQMRRVLERESRLAREDALTGLANRREFREQGRRLLAQAARQQTPVSVVFIDLDKFKQVNDDQGHEVGDALLQVVARDLQRHLRSSDVLGRLGGDEFALLLPGMDAIAAERYLAELQQTLLASMQAQGWPVTFSMGLVSYRQVQENLDAMLSAADNLMYEAKEAGRNRICRRTVEAGDLPAAVSE